MRSEAHPHTSIFETSWSPTSVVSLAIFLVFLFLLVVASFAQPVWAQTFTVLHTFTGGQDDGTPQAGLTIDGAGRLYGTTSGGFVASCGTIFRLTKQNSGWIFDTLYTFQNSGGQTGDGCYPVAPVTVGPDASLYGTTWGGGTGSNDGICDGCGTVFYVRPPVGCYAAPCNWTENVIYSFTAGDDGAVPGHGALIFDQVGDIYGTTQLGGYTGGMCSVTGGCGTVFQLASTPQGGWVENTVHIFTRNPDGALPSNGVVLDAAGNLYGATGDGGVGGPNQGYGWGTLFQLKPFGNGWTENILHDFTGGTDGAEPASNLIKDRSGNFITASGFTFYPSGSGPFVELSPLGSGWRFFVMDILPIHSLPNGSTVGLTMDAAGNIYGTRSGGQCGSVFKLTPSGGGWIFHDLHDFNGSDGCGPVGSPIVDASGNIYGATATGGNSNCQHYGCGTIWEITP